MAPYTAVLPKPLLPVGDRPILALLLEQLARAGVTRIDLCVGYLGELIRAYLADAPHLLHGVELHIHTEFEPLGTAGALSKIGDLTEPFIALNGDVLTTLDFSDLMREHLECGATLTVAAQRHETTIPLGVLDLDGMRVAGYTEKPSLVHTISLGVYAVDPQVVSYLERGYVDMPTLVDRVLKAGLPVHAYMFDGPWFDIGTRDDHEAAQAELLAHRERYLPGARVH